MWHTVGYNVSSGGVRLVAAMHRRIRLAEILTPVILRRRGVRVCFILCFILVIGTPWTSIASLSWIKLTFQAERHKQMTDLVVGHTRAAAETWRSDWTQSDALQTVRSQ